MVCSFAAQRATMITIRIRRVDDLTTFERLNGTGIDRHSKYTGPVRFIFRLIFIWFLLFVTVTLRSKRSHFWCTLTPKPHHHHDLKLPVPVRRTIRKALFPFFGTHTTNQHSNYSVASTGNHNNKASIRQRYLLS